MRQPGTNQNHWTAIPAAGNQFASEVMAAAARVLRLAMRLPPNKRNELPSLHASGPSRETAPYHVRDRPGRREAARSVIGMIIWPLPPFGAVCGGGGSYRPI